MQSHQERHVTAEEFKCIFDTYKNRVYGYVLAVAHSAYTAEEITQEIFLKLWLCRDMLGRVDNLEGYLFTIARHKTLNHLRKAATDARLLRELQSLMRPSANDVEELSLSTDYDHIVQEAVALLSPQRRQVYQLSRVKGLNHEEIAVHLQLSRSTVKNHLVEALRFIRGHLGRNGGILAILVFFMLD
ncbi:MAG TPA: RNA polymerase sigma-70 factor [Dinghuibacter sp.]|uniref:RNA polymerase sigma factor n=1 Tax=Dinghuibacter sp. TaxID=2024697 RepID=UPI002C85740F|nr:RNA polymerase sigma-70 factor [Dinghuibacter sp.]HTJ15076.1 RNA polymerase sigma-70 factor [Dinghuibacter sp.]